jgi:hypothetical protein
VDLGTTFAILIDRQLLPLTAQIEQVQNVVEDLEQTQLGSSLLSVGRNLLMQTT